MVDRPICRGCLIPEGRTKHTAIFSDDGKTANEIFTITNLIILNFTSNKCPAVLCQECFLDLKKAISFRDMMLKNDKYFRALFDERIASSLTDFYSDMKAPEEDSSDDSRKRRQTEGESSSGPVRKKFKIENIEETKKPELSSVIKLEKYEVRHVTEAFAETSTRTYARKSTSRSQKSPDYRDSSDSSESHAFLKDELSEQLSAVQVVYLEEGESGQPPTCHLCGKSFSKALYLKQHLKSHLELSHRCTTCGKKYATEEELREHLHKHAADKPFKCHLCMKSFNYKSDLNRHVMNHTQHKRFQCDQCEKSFARSDHLVKHARTHERRGGK